MDFKNKIILLADDDEDDRAFFEEALSIVEPSSVFFSSENGCEALERLETRGFSPDVVFLDINMPKMNGLDCLKMIKESAEYKKIPVVMYTTDGSFETRQECLELGADACIKKPPTIPEICNEIKKAFNKVFS